MNGTVLLIHDEIATIASVRRIMVAEGLHVVLATSAADGLTTFEQQAPPVVVLAPAVEGGRGHAVYDEIRSLPSGAGVRFLLLGEEIANSHDAEVVPLPIDPEVFRLQLQRALSRTGEWELAKPTAARSGSSQAMEDMRLALALAADLDLPDPWLAARAKSPLPPNRRSPRRRPMRRGRAATLRSTSSTTSRRSPRLRRSLWRSIGPLPRSSSPRRPSHHHP